MNKYLIKLADYLDKKGLTKEANYVGWIMKKAYEENSHENIINKMIKEFKDNPNGPYENTFKTKFSLQNLDIYSIGTREAVMNEMEISHPLEYMDIFFSDYLFNLLVNLEKNNEQIRIDEIEDKIKNKKYIPEAKQFQAENAFSKFKNIINK